MSTTTAQHTPHRPTGERLRTTAPVLAAVLMLFGLLAATALGLREIADVGVLLVGGM